MGFFNEYPSTNFHELNADWILAEVQQLIKDWAQTESAWNALREDNTEFKQTTEATVQSLQNFVNTYFDNLDVQNEINNKLTAMASDGTLSQLIAPYIQAQSSPIVVASTSDMTDNTKIYVLATDGVMYYYNGSQFVASDVVYGELDKITELSKLIVDNGIKRIYTENELNWTDGYYINYSDGSVVSGQSDYSVTDFVRLDRKDLRYLTVITSLTVSSRGMAFYDSSKTYITGHQNIGGSYGAMVEHTYEIPTDAEYIRFTCIKGYKNNAALFATDKIIEKLNVFSSLFLDDHAKYYIEWLDGTYINYSTGSQTNGASYSSTKYIPVLNSKRIYIKAFFDSVGDSGLAFYDSTQSYISGIQITGYPFEKILDVPANAYYVRFSVYTQDKDKCALYLNKNTELMPFYSKVLCIGDSLTQGAYYINGGTGESVRKGYPAYLGRIMNTPIDNAGYSGINARDWYNNRRLSNYSKYDAVIIWLGTNQGLTDTIETDCVGSDYTQYADTYTGCYCKIIESILDSSPNCNIYLVNVFASSGNTEVTQNVIRKIGLKYNLPVFDMSDWDAQTKPYLHGNINNVHFSVYGNMAIAKHFYEMISQDMYINYVKADKRPDEYIEYWNNTSRPS